MTASPRTSRSWIWFFAILIILTVGGITWEVWYNLHQQLKPEQFSEARELWRERGPRDYTLNYKIKLGYNPDPTGALEVEYTVEVRNSKAATVVGLPYSQRLNRGEYEFDTMDSLFDHIEKQMRADAEPGKPQPFVQATFDDDDGHVIHYVHSVMRTRERLEVSVKLKRSEE
jgi:hypothetical protein